MKSTILIRALVLGLSLAGPLATSVQAQTDGRVGTVESVRTRAVPNSGSTGLKSMLNETPPRSFNFWISDC